MRVLLSDGSGLTARQAAARVRAAGVRTAVPSFSALTRVQDKVSASATLAAAGLAQPPGMVLETAGQAAGWDRFPVFLKLPIGSAASGVGLITGRPAIREHLAVLGRELGWHGALSADAILGDAGLCYIDINPRLVEPGNARLSKT